MSETLFKGVSNITAEGAAVPSRRIGEALGALSIEALDRDRERILSDQPETD
jgi:hypothetical protein